METVCQNKNETNKNKIATHNTIQAIRKGIFNRFSSQSGTDSVSQFDNLFQINRFMPAGITILNNIKSLSCSICL